jgi:hypothetical protein
MRGTGEKTNGGTGDSSNDGTGVEGGVLDGSESKLMGLVLVPVGGSRASGGKETGG